MPSAPQPRRLIPRPDGAARSHGRRRRRPQKIAANRPRLSKCPDPLSICWTRGHGRRDSPRRDCSASWRRQGLSGVPERKENHLSPSWLSQGDTAWQLTAATLVGLMSVPGLAVLYGGVMQKRWSINSMMLTFATFATVLIVWVLWGFKMGFGSPF